MKKSIFIILLAFSGIAGYSQCMENKAACNSTFDDLRYAVVKINMTGFGSFTGFLINHTSNDGRLLVLTTYAPFMASCGNNPAVIDAALATTVFTFNSDYVSCSGSGATEVTTTGATLESTSGYLALLQLNSAPNLPELTYLGWDITSEPTSLACIFQTSNTIVRKGIVTANAFTIQSVNFNCNGTFSEASGFTNMLKISAWDQAEPYIESRGAPLIMNNLKAIGVYTVGNEVDCDKGPSYFYDLASASNSFMSHLRSGTQTNSATIKRVPCQNNLTLSGSFNQSYPYSAINTITSTQTIDDGNSVQYTAGTSVTLNSGFVSGTDFVAQIGSCTPQVITIAAKTEDSYNNNAQQRVQLKEFINPIIKIFPTLTSGNSSLFVETNQVVENLSLCIKDINGKTIMVKQINELQPNLPLKVEMPVVSAGLYFVHMAAGDYLFTTKLMVQ
ncbi:MAG TPA: T9SS type A sorting domain-containing protein [Chitinophagales bacterium]|nr:T9SS type A sorting domain-containing protein [Chitinophagales bacterium]